jgi:hypothetical protein
MTASAFSSFVVQKSLAWSCADGSDRYEKRSVRGRPANDLRRPEMLWQTNVEVTEGLLMIEKIISLLEQIQDERLLESIYWYIERKLVCKPPRH